MGIFKRYQYKLHVLNQLLSLKFLLLGEKLLQSVLVQIDKQLVVVSDKLPGFPGVISLVIPAPLHQKLKISPFIGTWSLTVGENILDKKFLLLRAGDSRGVDVHLIELEGLELR